MASGTDLTRLNIPELAPMIETRQVSPVEVTKAALARADQTQPVINLQRRPRRRPNSQRE